jgi:hypothetical protein
MKLFFYILFVTAGLFAQITKKDIETILLLDNQNPAKADTLYRIYLEKTAYKQPEMIEGILFSAISGTSLGFYESKSFGYKNDGWLPGAVRDWYREVNNSEFLLGKAFTWQKIWREIDYITEIKGYLNWFKYFGNRWYLAYPVHWIIKNTFATIVRDKMKYNEAFHSFNLTLIF